MKGVFSAMLFAILLGLPIDLRAQMLQVERPDAAYHPDDVLNPKSLLSPTKFKNVTSGRYVVVEGYVDYVASTWPEGDGDFHFEMQATDKLHTKNPKDGLVCEIDPLLQLKGSEALREIDPKKRSTYRKARVYGFLRFGTEANHAGVQKYKLPNGKLISGHWEIHPVERIESIDNENVLKIGPLAKYVSPTMSGRYGLDDSDFPKHTVSNYGVLRGTVKSISKSTDASGDLAVELQVNSTTYTAIIPQYYISNFDESTQTVTFVQVPSFQSINYSLAPSEDEQRSFYGLRNWRFRGSRMIATMAPVEIITK